MTDYVTIIRAVYSGLSQRQVAATYKVSRNTVALLVQQVKASGWLTLDDLESVDNAVLSEKLNKTANSTRDVTFRMPDYEYVHQELAKPHVTLKLLWEEYVEACQQNGERFYMETQFRQYYQSSPKCWCNFTFGSSNHYRKGKLKLRAAACISASAPSNSH